MCLQFLVISLFTWWRDAYLFSLQMLEIYLQFFCHSFKSMMEACLPIHIGNDEGMLAISCRLLTDMMEGCLPIHIGNAGSMTPIYCRLLIYRRGLTVSDKQLCSYVPAFIRNDVALLYTQKLRGPYSLDKRWSTSNSTTCVVYLFGCRARLNILEYRCS